MITGLQRALDGHIQAPGSTGCQNYMGSRLRKVKELRKTFPQLQCYQSRILGTAVDTAVDGGTHLVHIVFHGPADTLRLGK